MTCGRQSLPVARLSAKPLLTPELENAIDLPGYQRPCAILLDRKQLQEHLNTTFYTRLIVTSKHYQIAKSWMQQFDTPLRTLDALHLAIAVDLAIPIVTADIGLAKSAERFSVTVQILNP
jgi:predicted nucleic acid-binding protein